MMAEGEGKHEHCWVVRRSIYFQLPKIQCTPCKWTKWFFEAHNLPRLFFCIRVTQGTRGIVSALVLDNIRKLKIHCFWSLDFCPFFSPCFNWMGLCPTYALLQNLELDGVVVKIEIRDATIPFFQNRSDTVNSEDRPIQSDTSAVFFIFLFFNVT